MPKFSYRVQDEKGKTLEGVLEAPSEDHAHKFLIESHYEILDLIQYKKKMTVQGFLNRFSKVDATGFNFFVRQLNLGLVAAHVAVHGMDLFIAESFKH